MQRVLVLLRTLLAYRDLTVVLVCNLLFVHFPRFSEGEDLQ
jgi:hypothetical protein